MSRLRAILAILRGRPTIWGVDEDPNLTLHLELRGRPRRWIENFGSGIHFHICGPTRVVIARGSYGNTYKGVPLLEGDWLLDPDQVAPRGNDG